jgi:hypothetical protein
MMLTVETSVRLRGSCSELPGVITSDRTGSRLVRNEIEGVKGNLPGFAPRERGAFCQKRNDNAIDLANPSATVEQRWVS